MFLNSGTLVNLETFAKYCAINVSEFGNVSVIGNVPEFRHDFSSFPNSGTFPNSGFARTDLA